MRKVRINETESIDIHASSMTCLLYEKEFDGADVVTDIAAMGDTANFGTLRRALWAMAKTAAPARIPTYNIWLSSGVDVNYQETDWSAGVVQEAQESFFRPAKTAEAPDEQ